MKTETLSAAPSAIRWHVIGFRESTYQACQGAPVQAGSSCDKCGAGIRYVVTLRSDAGAVLNVGRDCAVTLEGGPELAEIRAAERHEADRLYRESPEGRRSAAERADREAARAARAASAETDHALALFGLRAIETGSASEWERSIAFGAITKILEGAPDAGCPFDDKLAGWLGNAWVRLQQAPACHYPAPVGTRVKNVVCTYLRGGAFEGAYGRVYVETFMTSAGEVLVWKGAGAWLPTTEAERAELAVAEGVQSIHAPTLRRPNVGERLSVTATIKSHGDYQGAPQTTVTRAKVVRP
jgi:hypothetical protein